MLDLVDAVALSLTPGVARPRLARALAAWFQPRPPLLQLASPDNPPGDPTLEAILSWLGFGPKAGVLAAECRDEASGALDRAKQSGIEAIGWGDPRYPPLLAAIPDPPVVLWACGDTSVLEKPAVAIVGSRAASPAGLQVAEQLGSDLAARGVVVTSGLARGVDGAAHRGAVDVDGRTVAVLGSGVDVIYPHEHAALARAIGKRGALVCELPPGTPPRPFHFPLRNRIISGLSLAVVVVEASERSGSLITASCALEQGREVMAVPGNVVGQRYTGCHALIRDGAAIIESAADVLFELGMRPEVALGAAGGLERGQPSEIPPALVPGEVWDLDAWAAAYGLDPPRMLVRLLELELQAAVVRAPGGWFVRPRRSC